MNFHRAFLFLFALLLGTGLNVRPLAAAPLAEPSVRLHWLGLKAISADTNATHFMAVWHLPQTTALVAQTLDKISRLPAHGATNAVSARLRPLLDDLVTSESYLEVFSSTNSHLPSSNSCFLLALRLPADRAALWQANLPAALPAAKISQTGEWTLIGLGAGSSDDSLVKFATQLPAAPAKTNYWLTADLDPAQIFPLSARPMAEASPGEVANSQLPTPISYLPSPISHFLSPISHIHLTATGEAGQVLTRAAFDFSKPLNLTLPPWDIPTNLIGQPLSSFTAVRGLASWLATLPAWKDLQLSSPPNQAFFWAHPGIPFMTYFAAPLPDASNQLAQLSTRLVQNANPWLATNHYMGNFRWQTNPPVLIWRNAFIISPFLTPVSFNHHDYVLGGLYPLPSGDAISPPAAFADPRLVYYQSELQPTERLNAGQFSIQTFRMIFHKAQMPAAAAGTLWLNNVRLLLDASTTTITQTGPARLNLARQSTLGFSALELQLLADWLESPTFPRGLHSFLAAPEENN